MIESNTATIRGYQDSDGNQGLASVNYGLSGCCVSIRLVNMGQACGGYWLARRKDNPRDDYILILPGPRWEQDARDDGYELIQKLSERSP